MVSLTGSAVLGDQLFAVSAVVLDAMPTSPKPLVNEAPEVLAATAINSSPGRCPPACDSPSPRP
jgi:hypothetical protein